MSTCTEWRPLAMKGICACGKRWWQHTEAVKEAATVKWLEQRNSKPEQLDALRGEMMK